jgi:hypothetical protein
MGEAVRDWGAVTKNGKTQLLSTGARPLEVRYTEPPMIGSVESASLFVRGSQSVRLVRIGARRGPVCLLVLGPGSESSSAYESPDIIECVNYQSQIERALVVEGYQLASVASADRRSGADRRGSMRGFDRRRELPLGHV